MTLRPWVNDENGRTERLGTFLSCKIYDSEGSWAEVVSEYEYEMARRLGVPGNKILFNGPYKPKEALARAAEEGAHIHLDHFDELYQLEQIAKEIPEGETRARFSPFSRAPEGEHITRVENSRGEMSIHMWTDGTTNPYRVKIMPPSLRNMYVFERLAELSEIVVADIPVVVNSIDPWYLDSDR